MKLLLVCFSPPTGAIAEVFSTFVNNLGKKVNVTVISPHLDQMQIDCINHIEIEYTSSRPLLFFGSSGIGEIYKKTKGEHFDAVLWFSTNIANVFSLPFIKATKHYTWCHEPRPEGRASKFKSLLYRINDHIMAIKVEKIFVAGESILKMCPKYWRKKIVICQFPSHDHLLECLDVENNSLKPLNLIKRENFKILFFGGIHAYKGLDVLAQAFSKLIEISGVENCSLKIIGAGDLGQFPSLLALKEKNDDIVIIHNSFMASNVLYNEIFNSDVIVFPYLTATGSNTINIAFSLKRLVVASDVGNFSDHIDNEVNGFKLSITNADTLSDCLHKIYLNPILQRTIEKNSRIYFDNNFKEDIVLNKFLLELKI